MGGYPRGIGLQDYVVNHGLTQRLLERPASEYPAYLSIGGAYVDTPVSDSLWAQYQGPGAVLAQGQWIDTPSVGIPYAYSVIGQLIGYSKLARGDSLGAERVLLRADSIARVIGIAQ